MAPNLSGRVAVVTGASRGLGAEIAGALAGAGAAVVLAARDDARLEATAAGIREATGAACVTVAGDLTRLADVERLRERTEASLGAASILVNAAGVFGPIAPFSRTDPEEWAATLMVNALAPYFTCRVFVPGMLERGFGRIVNVSSAAALFPPDELDSAYATSKEALNRMTRHLAAELRGTGVAAAVIHPGSVKTDMWADIAAKTAALGDGAGALGAWVERVARTGGDPPALCAELVLELVDPAGDGGNGAFHWPRASGDAPVPSW